MDYEAILLCYFTKDTLNIFVNFCKISKRPGRGPFYGFSENGHAAINCQNSYKNAERYKD